MRRVTMTRDASCRVLLVMLLSVCVWGKTETSKNAHEKSFDEKIDKFLTERLNKQDEKIEKLHDVIENQNDVIEKLQHEIANHDRELSRCAAGVEQNKQDVLRTVIHAHNISLYETSVTGCLYDVLDMSCSGDGIVLITRAEYGRYAGTCTDECCAPEPEDCSELMETTDIDEWTNLKLACNYQSECSFQFSLHAMITCEELSPSEYLTIYYVCSNDGGSGPSTEPVAFTAYRTTYESFSTGETIEFDYTLTNIGGHYNTENDTFICPFDGLYMFFVHVIGDLDDDVDVEIAKNDEGLVGAWADDYQDYNAASNSAMVECSAGDAIYVRATDYSYVHSNTDRLSTFSGVLITRY